MVITRFFKAAELTDEAVVVEGNIVTARPDSFIDFAVGTGILSGAIEESKSEFWKKYYRGSPR